MKCKRKIMVGIAFVAVVLCILFQSNTFGRKKSELIIEEVDLKNNCIQATAKNQLYDTDDNYIIYGVSNYLKGNLQLSYLKEGESILVISNGKVLLSDPYQFDKIYSIQLLQQRFIFSINNISYLQLPPLLSGGAVLILNNDAIDENDRPFWNLEFSQ